jgi:hypothetical protein
MSRLLLPTVSLICSLVVYLAIAMGKPVQETPETPPGDICQALKGPHPKKDVQIQPYCPDETPTPEPTPTTPGRKVEP